MSNSRLVLIAVVLADGMLVLAAVAFGYFQHVAVCVSILAATAILGVRQLMLQERMRSAGQSLRIEAGIRQPHYVQGLCQIGIYTYLGLYWDQIPIFAPLIVVQIIFAYAIEMFLSWWKYRTWRAGFGPFPIVFSTNLFLWFKEDYFFLQLVMIALCYIGREFIRWDRDGRNVHIINPSAFALTVACIGLMVTGTVEELTYAVDIIASFRLPPNFIEVVFLLGLVVQLLYGISLVTMGAVLAHCILHFSAEFLLGTPINPIPIDLAVFLGFTFLVTDPSTSPRTMMGKFLFGVTYGGGVFVLAIILRLTHQPAFMDKILMVPVVNLIVPFFDRLGVAFHRWVKGRRWLTALRSEQYAWTGIYAALFFLILPFQKKEEENWAAVGPPGADISKSMIQLQFHREHCHKVLPEPYQPFGFRSEVTQFHRIKRIYRDWSEDEQTETH